MMKRGISIKLYFHCHYTNCTAALGINAAAAATYDHVIVCTVAWVRMHIIQVDYNYVLLVCPLFTSTALCCTTRNGPHNRNPIRISIHDVLGTLL